jgi:hypothetical protein
LLWLFWRWGLAFICLGWPRTAILPLSVSQIAKIISVSHWHLAWDVPFYTELPWHLVEN